MTKRQLESKGYSVEVAENGNQALERLKAGGVDDFDVMITDLNMPVMDGFESVRRFRSWEAQNRTGRLPIIGFSANTDDDTRAEVAAAGMDAFFPKPFKHDDLIEVLRDVKVLPPADASKPQADGIATASSSNVDCIIMP